MVKKRLDKFVIELQLFAEKTEQPTAKKRQKTAEKGQLAQRPEINSVIVLLVAFFAIKMMAPVMVDGWAELTTELFGLFAHSDFELNYLTLQTIFFMIIMFSSKILLPIVGGSMAAGLAGSLVQIGFRFTISAVNFNLQNISPLEGLKRIFSIRSLAELFKSLLKVLLVGYVCYSEFSKEFMTFPRLTDMNLRASSAFLGALTMTIVVKVIVLLVIVAILDYAFQRWSNEKKMMMEKQEVKEEYKQSEGDPQLKAKIKQRQREVSMRRMMQMLPKADVVITNPTHFAVALQYDPKVMKAPLLLAKGQERVALRIK